MSLKSLKSSTFDKKLINVCHFHQFLQFSLLKFDHYPDIRAYILDLFELLTSLKFQHCMYHFFSGYSPIQYLYLGIRNLPTHWNYNVC